MGSNTPENWHMGGELGEVDLGTAHRYKPVKLNGNNHQQIFNDLLKNMIDFQIDQNRAYGRIDPPVYVKDIIYDYKENYTGFKGYNDIETTLNLEEGKVDIFAIFSDVPLSKIDKFKQRELKNRKLVIARSITLNTYNKLLKHKKVSPQVVYITFYDVKQYNKTLSYIIHGIKEGGKN